MDSDRYFKAVQRLALFSLNASRLVTDVICHARQRSHDALLSNLPSIHAARDVFAALSDHMNRRCGHPCSLCLSNLLLMARRTGIVMQLQLRKAKVKGVPRHNVHFIVFVFYFVTYALFSTDVYQMYFRYPMHQFEHAIFVLHYAYSRYCHYSLERTFDYEEQRRTFCHCRWYCCHACPGWLLLQLQDRDHHEHE